MNSESAFSQEEMKLANAAMQACALRFKGYDWEAHCKSSGQEKYDIGDMAGRFIATLEMSSVPEDNFAVFFWMQRTVRHWDTHFLRNFNSFDVAAASLFLELWNQEPPETWMFKDFCDKWARMRAQDGEHIAAIVRGWLVWNRDSGRGDCEKLA